LGGFSNFFLRRPFVSDAAFAMVVTLTVATYLVIQFTKQEQSLWTPGHVDWRMLPAALLILFAVWILAALALACSTRLDIIPTLAICSAIFLIGLMSDYLFGRHAEPVWNYSLKDEIGSMRWSDSQKALLRQILEKYDANHDGRLDAEERASISAADKARMAKAGMGGSWWASVLYTAIPNWQLFWLADAVETGKDVFHWGYVGKAFAYAFGYVGATLAVAVLLFEERELS
ncbi:MAG TPA: hypothetical protein VKA67_10170, partial [Verrucomicrobiae bacterium]|nr:hypothetical protein [Verrucomicrobiae bacterium]